MASLSLTAEALPRLSLYGDSGPGGGQAGIGERPGVDRSPQSIAPSLARISASTRRWHIPASVQ